MSNKSRMTHPVSALMRRTQELLRETSVTYLDIYKATDISPNWLTAFVNGKIPDPSVNRVEALYCFLSGLKDMDNALIHAEGVVARARDIQASLAKA